jgi:hypothetical protein
MSFGKYPAVTLALVRDRHLEARKLLATGVDPMAERKTAKRVQQASNENSFQNVAAKWLDHWREGKSLRHVDSVRRRMAADILPCLGSRPITEIEAPELVAMTKAIEKRGAHDIAKRALETAGQVFRYGIAHGYAKRNPASEIRPRDILKSVPTLDGKYEVTVTHTDGYHGVLTISEGNQVLHRESVGLSYGAIFGPDLVDVADWRRIAVEFVDGQKAAPTVPPAGL